MKVDITSKSVNSKVLYNEINDLIVDGLQTVALNWRNEDEKYLFISFINSLFEELFTTEHIEQWKVQCNNNNNSSIDMISGKYVLDVFYKQKNCLNTTNIKYTLQEDLHG